LDCNKDKALPNPTNFQSPVKPLFSPEIIEINSEDSEDDIEGRNPDPVHDPDPIPNNNTYSNTDIHKDGKADSIKSQVVIKTEPTDYLEGLTAEDFDCDPDSYLGEIPGVADAGPASITTLVPPTNSNNIPGTTLLI
jgi:hypothetical protein